MCTGADFWLQESAGQHGKWLRAPPGVLISTAVFANYRLAFYGA